MAGSTDECTLLHTARAWLGRQANVGGPTLPDKIEWARRGAGGPIPRFATLRPEEGTGVAGGSMLARLRRLRTGPAGYSRILKGD